MRVIAALVLAFLPLAASAAPAPNDEPPARVGRISWAQGEVAVYTDPDHGWEKGFVNSPLTSENSVWTEPGARAEVRIGPTTIRMDETTQLDVRRLDDDELRAHVVRGRITLRIREFDRGERYLLSTPQARFWITAAGRYRLDAEETTGEATLTVFSGSAQVEAGRRANIASGESVRVQPDGESFDFVRFSSTSFDEWSNQRDERIDRLVAETVRYVSPQMTGYEDLGEYGRWSNEPEYGAVWYPTGVGVDYVPYRDGRWVYTRPWGWTWVDYAPWGYAPFHYGRWVYVGNRWGWTPGRYVARPVWAPALVAWVGSSSGFTVSVGNGRAPAMGWYPLSPWETYRPWYTTNTRYITNVNVIVNNRPPPRGRDNDRDRHRERGTTVVLREDFVGQRPVQQGVRRVSGEAVREAVRNAPVVANPTTVLPPRTEARRPQGNTLPFQQGGPAAPAATRPAQPAQPQPVPPQGAPIAPRPMTPVPVPGVGTTPPRPNVGGEPVRPQAPAQTPFPQAQPQPAPQQGVPATRPRPSQPERDSRDDRRPAPQQQQPGQPLPFNPQPQQAAPVAPRVQPQPQQGIPVAPRVQPQPPQPQPQAQPQPQPQPQQQQPEARGRGAAIQQQQQQRGQQERREEKPEREKPEKPDKPEKPGQRER